MQEHDGLLTVERGVGSEPSPSPFSLLVAILTALSLFIGLAGIQCLGGGKNPT